MSKLPVKYLYIVCISPLETTHHSISIEIFISSIGSTKDLLISDVSECHSGFCRAVLLTGLAIHPLSSGNTFKTFKNRLATLDRSGLTAQFSPKTIPYRAYTQESKTLIWDRSAATFIMNTIFIPILFPPPMHHCLKSVCTPSSATSISHKDVWQYIHVNAR